MNEGWKVDEIPQLHICLGDNLFGGISLRRREEAGTECERFNENLIYLI